MMETITLNGDQIAIIIEQAFDFGWECGRDINTPPYFDGALANAKYQINQWLLDNGFLGN